MPKYVALIKIIEVNETNSTYRDRGVTDKTKESRELIDLEVRSNTLEGIKAKLGGHIALVDTE